MYFVVADLPFPITFPANWTGVGVSANEAVSQPVQMPVKVVAYKTTK
jgi:hypothetical protein